MNDLYEALIIKEDNNTCEIKIQFSDETHPVFQVHFPGNSLLPGFLQIDIISDVLSKKVLAIKKAKFLNPIVPNDTIIFHVKTKENQIGVLTKRDDQKCSEFTFVTE